MNSEEQTFRYKAERLEFNNALKDETIRQLKDQI